MLSRSTLASSVLLTLCFLPSAAEASGYYTSPAGIRAMGRAGANAVGANDLSAQTYNPAALIRLDRQITLQVGAAHQWVTFDRADEVDSTGEQFVFDPVHNSALPMVIPHLGAAWSFGRENLTLALGFYTPYAPMWAYPADGGQRYSLIDSTVLAGNLGPSLAIRITDWLSLGASVAWSFLHIDNTLTAQVVSSAFDATYGPEYDIVNQIEGLDPFAISSNAGVLIEPVNSRFSFGGFFSPSVTYDARGSLSADFSENVYYTGTTDFGKIIDVEQVTDEDVGLEVTLPAIARGGVLFRASDTLEIEANVVWQGWSVLDSLTVADTNLEIATTEVEPLIVDEDVDFVLNLRNTWSARIGAEAVLSDRWNGRAGVLYETGANPLEYQSVFLPDANRFGYGLGASLKAANRPLVLDFGLTQSFSPPHDVTGFGVRQIHIDPSTGAVSSGLIVGEGVFGLINTSAGVGLNWSL